MDSSEIIFIVILAATNLVAGFGCAVPIAKQLCKINDRPKRFFRYFVMLIGIYFAECVAFSAGMGTQVFSVGLAFVWGIVFGLWLRGRSSPRQIIKTVFSIAVYSSLPTVSFAVLIILAWLVGGQSIFSVEVGRDFGIPPYVPWPLSTMLGFCTALAVGTVVLKTVITTGEVSLFVHLLPRHNPEHLP